MFEERPQLEQPELLSLIYFQRAYKELTDDERAHTTEQVAYLVFGEATPKPTQPYLRTGLIASVSNEAWTTVTLDHEYADMVVVASANYAVDSAPLVTSARAVPIPASRRRVRSDRRIMVEFPS